MSEELLIPEAWEEIQADFDDIIRYSQELDDINTDSLFHDWAKHKLPFYELFGKKLIYEVPGEVTFSLPPESKKEMINVFCDRIDGHYANEALAEFIYRNTDGFFDNKVVCETEYNGIKIKKGMKLLRSFKYFEKEHLDDIQTEASMLIQQDKISGTLCFSIHPIDYLSLSENNANWRSCHALDGEYRAGNLSYMSDETTIITYLKTDDNVQMERFPNGLLWNNKIWRMLLFISQDWNLMFSGRQYPFETTNGMNMVLDIFKTFSEKVNLFSDWKQDYITTCGDIKLNHKYMALNATELKKITQIVTDKSLLHYNDITRSNFYTPAYALRQYKFGWDNNYVEYLTSEHTQLQVGNKVNCLHCGQHQIRLSETVLCDSCELEFGTSMTDEIGICPVCGERYFYDDGIWIDTLDDSICPDCADTEVACCECCGEEFIKNMLDYNRIADAMLCEDCDEVVNERGYM